MSGTIDYTPYINPTTGRVTLIATDVNGIVLQVVRSPPGTVELQRAANPDLRPILPEEADTIDDWPHWAVIDGVLTKTPPPTDTLAYSKFRAQIEVDNQAEQARLRWITPGAGQSMEYAGTREEAFKAIAAGGTPTAEDYPWLAAEQAALAAIGTPVTIMEVALIVREQNDAWVSAGTAIKETRRTAKLLIEQANTEGEVNNIVAGLTWPTPP